MAKFEKFDARKQIRGLAEARQADSIRRTHPRGGKMPLFDHVVTAIDETRQKYPPQILAARQTRFDID